MNNVSVWWHVAGATVDRADPDLRARPAPERSATSSPSGSTTPAIDGGDDRRPRLLVLRPAVRLPADAVHDHRLRRVARTSRRRPQAASMAAAQGHLAVDLLLGDRRLDPAAAPSCSRSRATQTATPTTRLGGGGVAVHLRRSRSAPTGRPSSSSSRRSAQFFCATSCMTSCVADDRSRSAVTAPSPARACGRRCPRARVPANAVIMVGGDRAIVTLPALVQVNIGTEVRRSSRSRSTRSSRSRVIGLYLCVRYPDLAALADGRRLRGRVVEPRRRSTSG